MKRRDFIRTVIVGGAGIAAGGLPLEKTYSGMPSRASRIKTNFRHIVRAPGHELRDGGKFVIPEPTEFRDLVIVGAGANALVAAYKLPDVDLVCLEKEPRTGGNAQRTKWKGIYATEGTAFLESDSGLTDFMREEFGLEPMPLSSNDAYIVGNKIIPDFYQRGFNELPYEKAVIDAFHRFKNHCNELGERIYPGLEAIKYGAEPSDSAVYAEALKLEKISLEQWMREQGYPKQVIDWCDIYCPPQVSGYARNVSALIGLVYMAGMGNYGESATYPGGLAKMAETLANAVRKQGDDRIRTGSFVVRVANTEDGKHVDVTYLHANELRTIRCKACIWGAQKHIAKHAIEGMPEQQKAAISKMVYNDISVLNLCYNKTIYNNAYYTWLDNAPVNNILPADWVLKHGKGSPDAPQILTCDWSNRPEHRGLLLSEQWVLEQCQKTAHRLNEIFPGSIDHLEEMRLVLRAHSWVAESPGYNSELLPIISRDVGRIVVTRSDHSNFVEALEAGLENAEAVRKWLA